MRHANKQESMTHTQGEKQETEVLLERIQMSDLADSASKQLL